MAEPRLLKLRTVQTFTLCAVALGAMILLVALPVLVERDPDWGYERTVGTVRFLQPTFLRVIRWTVFGAVVACCGFALWARGATAEFLGSQSSGSNANRSSTGASPTLFFVSTLVLPLFCLLLYPVVALVDLARHIAPWRVEDRLEDGSGRTYVFLDSSFLQGQTLALATLESDNPFWLQAEVHGTTNGDSPRSWASVVRPSPLRVDDYGQLYLDPQGLLLGVRYENRCYMAYDPATDRFWGHGDVETISPFALLSQNSALYPSDIAKIEQMLASGGESSYRPGPETPGVPRAAALAAEQGHANPEAQSLAKRWLEMAADLEKRFPSPAARRQLE